MTFLKGIQGRGVNKISPSEQTGYFMEVIRKGILGDDSG